MLFGLHSHLHRYLITHFKKSFSSQQTQIVSAFSHYKQPVWTVSHTSSAAEREVSLPVACTTLHVYTSSPWLGNAELFSKVAAPTDTATKRTIWNADEHLVGLFFFFSVFINLLDRKIYLVIQFCLFFGLFFCFRLKNP